jgi:erythromycin esterase-like protein
MGAVRDELNIGQLCRERFGANAVTLIGMGTHHGTVAAADDWDGDMKVKRVTPSRSDSVERLFHDAGVARCLLDLSHDNPATRALRSSRLERFIGVIYRPTTELQSHYAEASLAQQFDVLLWFDETTAVTPLAPAHVKPGLPDTYPFGL